MGSEHCSTSKAERQEDDHGIAFPATADDWPPIGDKFENDRAANHSQERYAKGHELYGNAASQQDDQTKC